MYSANAKIIKPQGEKPDEFESSISQVAYILYWYIHFFDGGDKLVQIMWNGEKGYSLFMAWLGR